MPQIELEEVQRRHPAGLAAVIQDPDGESRRTWVESLRKEFDEYYSMGLHWANTEPDVVLTEISAIIARLTEVRAHLLRTGGQRATRLRLDEVDPLLDALKEQFKIFSRLISVRELDFRVAGGAPS